MGPSKQSRLQLRIETRTEPKLITDPDLYRCWRAGDAWALRVRAQMEEKSAVFKPRKNTIDQKVNSWSVFGSGVMLLTCLGSELATPWRYIPKTRPDFVQKWTIRIGNSKVRN
jgi:hypothetical protein